MLLEDTQCKHNLLSLLFPYNSSLIYFPVTVIWNYTNRNMVKSPGFKKTSSFQLLTWNSSRSWDELLCGSILTISLYVGLNSLMGMLVSPQRQASNMASWMKTYCSFRRNEKKWRFVKNIGTASFVCHFSIKRSKWLKADLKSVVGTGLDNLETNSDCNAFPSQKIIWDHPRRSPRLLSILWFYEQYKNKQTGDIRRTSLLPIESS